MSPFRFLLTVIVLVVSVYAKDIYISQGRGNDETGDGSSIRPYRTLAKALTLIADGDKIRAEIGAYQHTSTINKAITLEGIREHAKLPYFQGPFVVKSTASFTVQNIEAEYAGDIFTIEGVGKVSISQMTIGPGGRAFSVKGVDLLEVTDVAFKGITSGPIIGATGNGLVKVATLNRVKFNGIRSGGVQISNVDRLVVDGSEFNEMCVGVSTACGVRILDTRNFVVRNSKAVGSELGFHIENSEGSLENVQISDSKRIYSSYGGGLFVKRSNVRTKLLVLTGNSANEGAGFFCDGGSLNMFSGKIEGNTASRNGGAGHCINNCAFFADQVIVRDNKEGAPTGCRGL